MKPQVALTKRDPVKAGRTAARSSTRVIAGEQGAQRSVVVERRVIRKFGNDKRTGT